MGFFKWLYRQPGRINRSVEKTVVASAVVQGEAPGQTVVDPGAMNAALGEMQGGQPEGDDSARIED
jgi:hypothetical protein